MPENAKQPINNSRSVVRLPIFISVALVAGIWLGASFFGGNKNFNDISQSHLKFKEILQLIDKNYVDSVNTDELVDFSIQKMLEKLDPHTSYFNAKDAVAARSQLEGGYDGIGIEFNLSRDTVQVVTPLSGGPSEAAGVLSGDKLIRVNGESFTGKKIDNGFIYSKLRGKRGSEVKLEVLRQGNTNLLSFTVKRDRIATFSIDATYMIDRETGYIKVNRFSETTYDEFKTAIASLKAQGLKKLMLDLRGNPGGYMDRAYNMADEFIGGDKLLVYTDGKDNRYDRQTRAQIDGMFEEGAVVVLLDEGSASASEIVAGALQDHDRALVVGRRSFGKGLVQMPIKLSDGSELRLTISRYYTPSGRSIQKPYEMGKGDEYEKDFKKRVSSGELYSGDSIKYNQKMKFKTDGGRPVFGGGGISPDVFVARDTSLMSTYLYQLWGKNTIREYALKYTNENRKKLEKQGFEGFLKSFTVTDAMLAELLQAAASQQVKYNEKEYNRSKPYIRSQVKAFVGRYVWQKGQGGLNNEYYQVMSGLDNVYQQALQQFKRADDLARGKFVSEKE